MSVFLLLIFLVLASTLGATASPCPGRPDALGTSRVLTVDAASTPRVGRKHFPHTLPLAAKEVVLTFDDGPEPGPTQRVLDALARECVLATFFLVGQRAAAYPDVVRRVAAEGHTVAHHTWSHRLLGRIPLAAAEAEIDRGIAAVQQAVDGRADTTPSTPFFRFPGFLASPALLERLETRGMVVFGADLWASDWLPLRPSDQLAQVLSRLQETGGGILLMHDIKSQTAEMLPALLRALKIRGYRVVHMVPASRETAAK